MAGHGPGIRSPRVGRVRPRRSPFHELRHDHIPIRRERALMRRNVTPPNLGRERADVHTETNAPTALSRADECQAR